MVSYVFQRYELKYLLTPAQAEVMKTAIEGRLSPDAWGKTTIQSLYFDTENFRLARASQEKPIFKEKLRLRSYGFNDNDRTVYLEMKRKSDSVVYKRRIPCKEGDAPSLLAGDLPPTQIGREIAYFLKFYGELKPKILILCEREAFFDPASDLRVTFDRDIRYRTEDLNFHTSLQGQAILPEGMVLMELKAGASFPLWLCNLLSKEQIRRHPFSKYISAYEREQLLNQRSFSSCLNPSSPTEPLARPAFSSFF